MNYRVTILIRAGGIWRGTLLAILLFCSPILLAHTTVLVKNQLFCDEEKKLCMQGWIAYENHFNTIRVDARLAERSVPGTISLRFSGTTRAGEPVSARLEIRIDGRYQEIIKASIVPDAPSRTHWTMSVFYFTADK
ncbi:MAG: hypothetical protein IH927_07970 [Proteobacteria bacterium]|nr:hypothetical protein [Pseudomonadota bacterium]